MYVSLNNQLTIHHCNRSLLILGYSSKLISVHPFHFSLVLKPTSLYNLQPLLSIFFSVLGLMLFVSLDTLKSFETSVTGKNKLIRRFFFECAATVVLNTIRHLLITNLTRYSTAFKYPIIWILSNSMSISASLSVFGFSSF